MCSGARIKQNINFPGHPGSLDADMFFCLESHQLEAAAAASSPRQHSLWNVILSDLLGFLYLGPPPKWSELANTAGTGEFCHSDWLGHRQVWNCSQEQLHQEIGGSSDLQALQGDDHRVTESQNLRSTESQNELGWKRYLISSSPNYDLWLLHQPCFTWRRRYEKSLTDKQGVDPK